MMVRAGHNGAAGAVVGTYDTDIGREMLMAVNKMEKTAGSKIK